MLLLVLCLSILGCLVVVFFAVLLVVLSISICIVLCVGVVCALLAYFGLLIGLFMVYFVEFRLCCVEI